MTDDLNHYVPSRLDDPEKFLFFRKDVALIGMAGVVGGIMLDHVLSGLTIGVTLAYAWQKFTSGKHPGMSTHIGYWIFGQPTLKALPPSAIRELNG